MMQLIFCWLSLVTVCMGAPTATPQLFRLSENGQKQDKCVDLNFTKKIDIGDEMEENEDDQQQIALLSDFLPEWGFCATDLGDNV